LRRRGYKAVIASLEVTFYTDRIPQARFARHLCSRARERTYRDKNGKTTIYGGSTRGPWDLRLYEKTDSIVRVEFILRSSSLRALSIRKPQDLLLVKSAQLWQKVGFHEVNSSKLQLLPQRVRKRLLERGVTLQACTPARVLERELRRASVNPRRWVVLSDGENLLRRMQSRLIW